MSGGQVTEDAVLCLGMGNPAWGAGRVPTFSTQIPLMDAKPEKLKHRFNRKNGIGCHATRSGYSHLVTFLMLHERFPYR